MKEIGGYFELEKSTGKEYYDYLAFNSARNALQFIIRKRNINKIYLPYYLCLVIEETLKKENVEINYYHVDDSFLPIIENYDNESYVYITNYFGLLTKDIILKLKEKYKIILDNVQAFFLEGFDDIDTIYTCRKFFGVVDGAYLYTNLECNENYEIATSLNKLNYLLGRYEENASKYYEEYIQSENSLINQNIKLMSKITHNMLKSIDYEIIKSKRKENYYYVSQKLNSRNLLNLNEKESLFMYPLLLKDGWKIKKELINNKVYIPTLWPGVEKFPLNDFEANILKNLVLIPIDQRYSIDDMDYICGLLNT